MTANQPPPVRPDVDALYGAEARPLLDHIADQKRRFKNVVLSFEQADLAVKCINFVVDATVNEAMRLSPARDAAEGGQDCQQCNGSGRDTTRFNHDHLPCSQCHGTGKSAPPKPAPDAVRSSRQPPQSSGDDQEVGPHIFIPSVMHMGDCNICGNVEDSSLHIGKPKYVKAQSSSDGERR